MSWSTDFADLQDDIISACSKHERENERKPDYRRAFPFQGYFVKFGPHKIFNPEVMTLKYLADLAAKDSSAPRVPRVLHYFYQPGRMGYVLMEFIQFVQVSPGILSEKAAQAVRWMHNVQVPGDVILGPKGGGRAHHKVFRDSEAPRSYSSIMALERYLNTAVKIVRQLRSRNIPDISFADEPLVLTQSDMDRSNFAVDTTGRPVILDFEQIGWLPKSLELFTLLNTTGFARVVSEHLFTPEEIAVLRAQPNLKSIAAVKGLLGIAARPCFDLDADGNKITRTSP